MDVKEAFDKFLQSYLRMRLKSWRENMVWKTNGKENCLLFLFSG